MFDWEPYGRGGPMDGSYTGEIKDGDELYGELSRDESVPWDLLSELLIGSFRLGIGAAAKFVLLAAIEVRALSRDCD